MARYFFDTEDGELIRDEHGIDCASLSSAYRAALLGIVEIGKDVLPTEIGRSVSVYVRDEEGQIVFDLKLQLTVTPRLTN